MKKERIQDSFEGQFGNATLTTNLSMDIPEMKIKLSKSLTHLHNFDNNNKNQNNFVVNQSPQQDQ